MVDCEIFIGWDSRERTAWDVCARSIIAHAGLPPFIRPISMDAMREVGLYRRPTSRDSAGRLHDDISHAPMSTEFALARFFVPFLARSQYAIFCDADFMFRADIAGLIAHAENRYAMMVVKHPRYTPTEDIKMDGQEQTSYDRKNWSSLMIWNMSSAGARRLNVHDANTRNGLWLHTFGWLEDKEIGGLPPEWNWLEGTSDSGIEPKAVHFTRGTPDMGLTGLASADEWNAHLPCGQQLIKRVA